MKKDGKCWNAEAKQVENIKPKRWRAEKGQPYYFALPYKGCLGYCCDSVDSYYDDDNRRYHSGNYFRTQQDADLAGMKMKELLKQINP